MPSFLSAASNMERVPEPGFSQNPACLGQKLWRDARLADPRMARSNHDRQRIAFHFPDGQRGIVNLALDETEVCISSMDSLGDLLGVCDRDVQIDAWMGVCTKNLSSGRSGDEVRLGWQVT